MEPGRKQLPKNKDKRHDIYCSQSREIHYPTLMQWGKDVSNRAWRVAPRVLLNQLPKCVLNKENQYLASLSRYIFRVLQIADILSSRS